MKQISFSETVLFYDTDCGGVVSNIAYLRFVERARCLLFAELGMDLRSMNETGLFPAVVRTEIDYRFPARLGDELEVRASLLAVEKVRVTCGFTLVTGAGTGAEKKIAEAVQVVALVQMPSGKPRRTPEEWRSYIET